MSEAVLRVRGGAGGVAVELDRLDEAAAALARSGAVLTGLGAELALLRLAPALLAAAALDPRGAAHVQAEASRALGARGVAGLAARTSSLGAALAVAVTGYRGADAAASSAVAGAGAWLRVAAPGPALVLAGPGLAAVALAAGGPRTVVVEAPVAVPAGRPAAGVAGLLSRVGQLAPAPSGSGAVRAAAAQPGRVRVERITRPGRPPAAVVYVPGTQTWSVGGPVPMDAATNLRALAGGRTASGDAVVRALRLAGVGPREPVLLVGHSQGGMTATALAGDPRFRAEFRPVAVLTAGAPLTGARVPPGVAVLALEHEGDVVPFVDGARPPDAAHWTTVVADSASSAPHGLAGYARTGEDVDASDHPSLLAWREAAAPFLDGAGARSVSTDWVARRAP